MGIFDTVLYSTAAHPFPEIEIKKLITAIHIPYLTHADEQMLQNALIARRHADGTISLQQIYQLLTELKNKNAISLILRDKTMAVVKTYFEGQFPNS